MNLMISNLAYIHPEAKIGKDVIIEPFAYVAANVTIDEGTWVGPNSTIMDGARIGKKCRIFPSAVVSGIPQDLKFRGEDSTAEIGDNTTIRECATVNRGTAAVGKTIIGAGCLLMAYSHIGHDCFIGNNVIVGNSTALAGEVDIDDFAILSAGTMVHQFAHIGAHVMIGGGAKVRIDVPPFIKADRDPLSFLGLNSVGLIRRGFEKERIDEIHEIYRAIYLRGMNFSQALEFVEKEFKSSPDRNYILEFIRKSERGIIRAR
jgi:UDP-N-acetylglucosamine acyltransferase